MSPLANKLLFTLVATTAISFWFMNLFDRVFLGKHTLNQVLLGSELGIWCAAFSHFVLRDQIFAHFKRVTFDAPGIDKAEAVKLGIKGTAIFTLPVLVTCIVGQIMATQKTLK